MTARRTGSSSVCLEGGLCIYIYVYIYIYTYVHTYVHTYIHTYIHTYVYTYTHTHIHIQRAEVEAVQSVWKEA